MIQEATSLTFSLPTTMGKYTFTVTSNSYGDITVSEVRRHGYGVESSYPADVQRAISTAINRLEDLMAGVSTLNGSVVLTAQSEGQIVFTTPLANTEYRVVFSIDDFVIARVKTRATTGFTFELSAPYTGTLRYDVLI